MARSGNVNQLCGFNVDNAPNQFPSLGDLIRTVLRQQKVNHPKSYITHEYASRHLLRHAISKKLITEFTEQDWDDYVHDPKNSGRKLATEKQVLSKAIHLGRRNPRILVAMVELPKLRLPKKHTTSDRSRPLSEFELEAIYKALKSKSPGYALRWRLIIALGAMCGMRRGEICKLRYQQFDLHQCCIKFDAGTTKDGNVRIVPIPPVVAELIERYWNEVLKGQGDYLFPSRVHRIKHMTGNGLYGEWRSILKAAGVESTFHNLRHTCITKLVRAKFALTDIKKGYGVSPRVIEHVYHHEDFETRRRMASALQGNMGIDP